MITYVWEPIMDQCEGCQKIIVQLSLLPIIEASQYCSACLTPSAKWRNGKCNLATHTQIKQDEKGKFIDPLKASKKAAKEMIKAKKEKKPDKKKMERRDTR